MKPSSEDQVPYLKIGTEVSAKYRGAFCEAKVKHVEPMVKCRVTLKDFPGNYHVDHNSLRGGLESLKAGGEVAVLASAIELPAPEDGDSFLLGTLIRFNDASVYSVVFNDGDERTLRRSQLVLKGDKHYEESSTLDQLPLHNPEQFGTPVIGKRRGGRTTRAGPSNLGAGSSQGHGDDSGSESGQSGVSGRVSHYSRRLAKLIGRIMKIGGSDGSGPAAAGLKGVPCLVVVPSANPSSEVRQNQLLVKSYRDNRFHVVSARVATLMTREALVKEANASQDKGFVAAVERALLWVDSRELPHTWADRETLLGIPVGEASGGEDGSGGDSSDSEGGSTTQEQRDHWLAMLFNFMDSIGSPINKVPTVANKDLDLYRLARIVRRLGGSSRVSRDMRWPLVSSKMRLPPVSSAYASIRSAYARYLQQFEDFTRKIGTPSMSFPSGGRRSSATSRGGGGQLTPRERRPSQSQEGTQSETRRRQTLKEEAPASPPILTPRPSGEAAASLGDSEPQPPTLVAAGGAKRPKSLALTSRGHSASAPVSPLAESAKSKGKKTAARRRKDESAEVPVKGKPRTPRTPGPCLSGKHGIGAEVHVRCIEAGQNKVYEARINAVDATADRYNVHYKGWKKRYDEWVDSSRIIDTVTEEEGVVEEEQEVEEEEEEMEEEEEEDTKETENETDACSVPEPKSRQRRDRARSADPVAKAEPPEREPEEEEEGRQRRSARRLPAPKRGVKSEPSSAAEEEDLKDELREVTEEKLLSEEPNQTPDKAPDSPSSLTREDSSPTPRTRRRRRRSEQERVTVKRQRYETPVLRRAALSVEEPAASSTPPDEESSEEDSEDALRSVQSPVEAGVGVRRPDVLSGQEEVVSKVPECPSTPSTDGMQVDKEAACLAMDEVEMEEEEGTEEEGEEEEEIEDEIEGIEEMEEDEEEEEIEEGMEEMREDDEEEERLEDTEEEGTSMATGDELETERGPEAEEEEEEEELSVPGEDFEDISQGARPESSGEESSAGGECPAGKRPQALPLQLPPSPGSLGCRRRARFAPRTLRRRTLSNGAGPSSISSPETGEPPAISPELPPAPALSRLRPFVRPTPSFIPDNLDQVKSYEEREKILVDSIKACQQRWREVKQEMKELDREEAQRRAKRRRRKSSQNPPVLSAVYPTPPQGLLPRSAASTPDSTAPVTCIASS